MKLSDIEGRMDDGAKETFKKLAKGKTKPKLESLVKKIHALGLKNRSGRIGAVEVQKASASK